MSLFVSQGKTTAMSFIIPFPYPAFGLTFHIGYPAGILVTASQRSDNSYSYNTVLVVLLTEMLKLVISAGLYCRE